MRLVSTESITASEAVALLRELDPRLAREFNERKFHYTAALVGADTAGFPGAVTLYDWLDVALVRLVLVMEDQLISRPVARAAITAVAPVVRDLLSKARPVSAVVVVPIADRPPWMRQPPVLTSKGHAESHGLGGIHIELAAVIAGIREGVRRIRAANETIRVWSDVKRSTGVVRIREHREEQDEELRVVMA